MNDGEEGAGAEPGGLSPEQQAAVERARWALKPIQRSTRYATMTYWTVGGFGVLTILWGLIAGAGGLVVGAALVAVAWNEKRGRDRLRALDPEGARILGWNQVILAVVITLYLIGVILRSRTTTDPSVRELEEMVGIEPGLVAQLIALVYGAVMVMVDIIQALTARFHFRRQPMVEALRRGTPDWVLELLCGPGAGAGW